MNFPGAQDVSKIKCDTSPRDFCGRRAVAGAGEEKINWAGLSWFGRNQSARTRAAAADGRRSFL